MEPKTVQALETFHRILHLPPPALPTPTKDPLKTSAAGGWRESARVEGITQSTANTDDPVRGFDRWPPLDAYEGLIKAYADELQTRPPFAAA